MFKSSSVKSDQWPHGLCGGLVILSSYWSSMCDYTPLWQSQQIFPTPVDQLDWSLTLSLPPQCEVCDEDCLKPRPPGCPHPCTRPCHPGDCPPCGQMIRQRCHCKISLLYVECTSVQTQTHLWSDQLRECSCFHGNSEGHGGLGSTAPVYLMCKPATPTSVNSQWWECVFKWGRVFVMECGRITSCWSHG